MRTSAATISGSISWLVGWGSMLRMLSGCQQLTIIAATLTRFKGLPSHRSQAGSLSMPLWLRKIAIGKNIDKG